METLFAPEDCQARLRAAPESLVTDGRFNLGVYREPLPVVNPLDAALRFGLPLPRFAKNLILKEWQHFALASPRFYVSVVVFNAKRLALTHVSVYDRETRRKVVHERRLLPGGARVPMELRDAWAGVSRPGYSVAMHNHLADAKHHIEFECAAAGDKPAVSGKFIVHEDPSRHEPIVVCMPFSNGRAMYSHKGVFPAEGELHFDGEAHRFSVGESYALPDIHKGYYPYVMKWHWTTGGGHDDTGRLIGFNLTDNQVEDQASYNENALWVDGHLHLLPPVNFTRNEGEPWHVRDAHGRVDVRFYPEVSRDIDANVLILRSKYHGPYGRFEGSIVDSDGNSIDVGCCYGMAEDFYLRA